jgi:hypothetical protein
MKSALKDRTVLRALISTEIMILVTSIHHVYRLGLELLIPAIALLLIPIVLTWWYSRGPSRLPSLVFAAYAAGVFFYFGIVDGFLDHVLKAVGLDNTTFLPGSDAEVIETVFHLWSPEAGHLFYEATGILTFVFGLVAMFFTYSLVRRALIGRPATAIAVTEAS